MLRRLSSHTTALVSLPLATAGRNYNFAMFKNPERRPQLTPEERANVKINYDEWPEEFRDYDPEDPYKRTPDFIEGMSSWNLFLWGAEAAFIYQFYEVVFPKGI